MNKNNVVINVGGSMGVIDVNLIKSVTLMQHDQGYHNITIYTDSVDTSGKRERIIYYSKDYVDIKDAYDAIINKMSSIKE